MWRSYGHPGNMTCPTLTVDVLKKDIIEEYVPLLQMKVAGILSRRGSDSWLKLWKLGVCSDVGLGLSLCAVPLLQFRSQRLEEVGSERRSKVVARTVIKTVNDEEGTNSRRRR